MSAVTIEHSELLDVHEPPVSEETKEFAGEQSFVNAEVDGVLSRGNKSSETDCKYKQNNDKSAAVRSVVIGDDEDDDDEDSGNIGDTVNTQENIDPYKDYDTFLYDHDYTGMFRPANIPKIVEEGYDSMVFPVMPGLSSHFADDDFEEQQNPGSRNLGYSGETMSPLYRFRDFPPRQNDGGVEKGHGIHPTTSYRLSSNPVVYGGKTVMRYSSINGPQAYRASARDAFVAPPSLSRTITNYGTARRINFSGGSIPQRKTIRTRFGERPYEQPGLRVMPSPTKQYAESPAPFQSSAASFVADPMRAANDNAPAPFIVPARGSRPSLRGKGQANRAQQAKGKMHEPEEKQSDNTEYKLVCGLPQKNENVLQVGSMVGEHPGRIYEPQLDMASSNRNYISKTILGPAHASHSEFTYNHSYQQNGEVDASLNLPTTSTIQHSRQSTGTNGEDTENIRAESPVTSIVESAHREAINRASESAHGNDSVTQVKVLTPPTGQALQQLRYSASENDQSYEGGQRQRFHSYVQYDQQMVEFYNESSQEQCNTAVTSASAEQHQQQHNYFADEEQRTSIDERYLSMQAAQRRRFSSRSSSCSSYNENPARAADVIRGRMRRGRQVTVLSNTSRESGSVRQLPSPLPNRLMETFVRSDEKHLERDPHILLQPSVAEHIPGEATSTTLNLQQQQQQQQQQQSKKQHQKQQQRLQQVSSTVTSAIITHTSESVTASAEQFSGQQTLQHTQLSSPEQQLPVTGQQYIPSLLGESVPNNVDSDVPRNYNYITTETGRPDTYVQHLAQQTFINEETSSGDELGLGNSAQTQVYDARRIQEMNMRSSISAAEEETSFAEDQSEERGTEEEEQRTQKNVIGQVNKLDEYDGWSEGDEYTTRCYCTMNHNDDFMIQCDVCNVWQHMVCVSIDKSRVPKVYKCEKCNPRLLKLSVAEAKAIQMKYLETKKRKKLGKPKISKPEQRTRKKMLSRTKERKTVGDGGSKKFLETNSYDYSRTVAALAKKQQDTGNIEILDGIKSNETVRVMYVAQDSEGLVSTRSFRKGDPVVLVCGRICMPSECSGREKPGSIMQFVMLYSIYIGGQDPEPVNVCVDARRAGSTARFARRSCRPNVKLQHMFSGGKLYIYGVAIEDIERGDEVTLPFDPDYALSKRRLVCACSPDEESLGSEICKIRKMASAIEEDSSVVQKDLEKRVYSARKNSGRGKNKKIRNGKEQENQITSGDEGPDEAVNQSLSKQIAITRPGFGRKLSMSSVGQISSVSGGLTATDEESVVPDADSTVSSKSKNEAANEHTPVRVAPRAKRGPKAANAAVKAATQKKRGAIKLKRRAKKGCLRSRNALKKKNAVNEITEQSFKCDFNRKSENTTVSAAVTTVATAAVSGIAVMPKKRPRLTSNTMSQVLETKLGNEKSGITSEKVGDEEQNTPLSEENVLEPNRDIYQKDISVKVEAKDEIGTESCNYFEPSSTLQVSESRNVVDAECKKKSDAEEPKKEAMKVETDVASSEATSNGARIKRKSIAEVDKDSNIVAKKFKEDDDVKTSDLESGNSCKREKQANVAGAKKSIHHRRELPEVEMMNYMLPGDRNKTETREERKMKQQLALFERMQRESKKKEEKRLQKTESLMSAKNISVTEKKLLEKGSAGEIEKQNTQKAFDFNGQLCPTENKNGTAQVNSNSPARRSARVTERELVKDVSVDEVLDSGTKKSDLNITRTLPPSQHPAFLNAPRKRWAAAAARSSSLENSVAPNTTAQSGNAVQKSYLLRNIEQSNTKDSNESAHGDIVVPLLDEDPEKSDAIPSKKIKESVASIPDVEQKESMSPAVTKSRSNKTECFSNPAVAFSKISEASRKLAACYAQMCAMTSDLGVVDFKLPVKDFPKKEFPLRSRFCNKFSTPISSVINNKPPIASPKKPQKKKMSLDEYKKRKETSSVPSDDKSEENPTSSKSFIPTIKDNDLEVVSRRALLKLGSIPDPAQLRDAPTASLDDLKRRIYGKPSSSTPSRSPRMTNQPRGRTPPETNETNFHSPISSQPKCSPPPPAPSLVVPSKLKIEPKEPRLPLEERLQMLLGGADPSLLTSSGPTLRPPPPPPPPPPPLPLQPSPHTRGVNSRKAETTLLHSVVRGRTPPPPPPPPPSLYNSGLICRPRRH